MSDLVIHHNASRPVMRSRLRSLIGFLPNLLKLLYRLMRDARVSRTDKAVLAGTILYVIAPLDFLPDFIPFIGQVDDSYLVAIALLRLINRTSAEIVQEHWEGGIDIKALVTTIANLAQFFLPIRLREILVGRLERPAAVANFDNYAKKRNRDQDNQ
ncbi:MAG: DUF1232 domain-containing protein [Acidobacteriota bacterium]